MADVEFEEDFSRESFRSRAILGDPVEPAMTRSFVKWGVAKNSKQASWFLWGIICFCLFMTGLVIFLNVQPFLSLPGGSQVKTTPIDSTPRFFTST